MDHQPRESGCKERKTAESRDMFICKVKYCKAKSKLKPAYISLSYNLYMLEDKEPSQRPTKLEDFRHGSRFKLDKDNVSVSRATEANITGIIQMNRDHSDVSIGDLASRALLISEKGCERAVVFDDTVSRNRWFSAIRARMTTRKDRMNQALAGLAMSPKHGATIISNGSSAANGIAGIIGATQNIASVLGGVAILGPLLNGIALMMALVDRGIEVRKGKRKLPIMQSRLTKIWKRLKYALDVLIAADEQNEEIEIMKKILTMFDECSAVMRRVENQLMKSGWKQYISVEKSKQVEQDLDELEKKIDITHIVELVSKCKKLEEHVNNVEYRVTALEEGREGDSPVKSYASVPRVPTAVVSEAVNRYQELKDKLLLSIGSPKRSVAIWGEGGTGKTMACVLLANDQKLREAFCDGIHFIKQGYDWSEEMVLQQVANVVEDAGGVNVAERIRKHLKPGSKDGAVAEEEVMRLARNWMEGRKVLIVADNVWDIRFVEILSKLAVAPESVFLFTTRSFEIACFSLEDAQFHFSALRLGTPGNDISSAIIIFDSHYRSAEYGPEKRQIRDELLKKVSGLQLAIASAGRLVAACGWEDAMSELESFLREEDPYPRADGNHPGLCAIMRTSLFCLDNAKNPKARQPVRISENNFKELQKKHGPQCFREMYLSLVVLSEKEPSAPIKGTLSRLWGLSDDKLTHKVARAMANLSLATVEGEADAGQLMLHDLQYLYCKSKGGRTPPWKIRMNFLLTYCAHRGACEDYNCAFKVKWAEEAFHPPARFPEFTSSTSVRVHMFSSLKPRDLFLAKNLGTILECIASDSASDPDIAQKAKEAIDTFKDQHKKLATTNDLQLRASRAKPDKGVGHSERVLYRQTEPMEFQAGEFITIAPIFPEARNTTDSSPARCRTLAKAARILLFWAALPIVFFLAILLFNWCIGRISLTSSMR